MTRHQISFLDSFFAEVSSLPSVGEKRSAQFQRLLGTGGEKACLLDLLFLRPTRFALIRPVNRIHEMEEGNEFALGVEIVEHLRSDHRGKGRRCTIRATDGNGFIDLTFFSFQGNWPFRSLPMGERLFVVGSPTRFRDRRQIVHPRVFRGGEIKKQLMLVPVYPGVDGLNSQQVAQHVGQAIDRIPSLPEWHSSLEQTHADLSFRDALAIFHGRGAPKLTLNADDRSQLVTQIQPEIDTWRSLRIKAENRLASDELLASQLALRMLNRMARGRKSQVSGTHGSHAEKVRQKLPWPLTGDQIRSVDAIAQDLMSDRRMVRLLHGDVGSGKTIVAFLAMVMGIDRGDQSALMAPTEMLARQHLSVMQPLAHAVGLELECLTAVTRAAERRRIQSGLADGSIPMVVGTHALIQPDVKFRKLRLAVIDEQHRFGVRQRWTLARKGEASDILLMSATPIPRTLRLAVFGDMDTSKLQEKPPGRAQVVTRVLPVSRLESVVTRLRSAFSEGAQAYWVCPLIEEGTEPNLMDVTTRGNCLSLLFPDVVGIIHGKMPAAEREKIVDRFRDGTIRLLVATTVVEVGVDVAGATIMVIEHAEIFGLSQLHQLRGRVGRGTQPASCLLLYGSRVSSHARSRLGVMRTTNDGFEIAEKDLELRGGGDILGVQQSGDLDFVFARFPDHVDVLEVARDCASKITGNSSGNSCPAELHLTPEIRALMFLFRREKALQLAGGG